MTTDESKRVHNLDLWEKLEVTDPNFTKRFDKGNFKGTAVDAVYNIKRVTEQLGPVGFAWGWHIVKDELVKFDDGSEPTWIHNCVVRAWFRQPEGQPPREVEHVGSTIAARHVGRGPNRRFMVDDEYAKKSVTDALSKIMVGLGASADIWLGRFDGNKYTAPVPREPALESEDPPRPAHTAKAAEPPAKDSGRAPTPGEPAAGPAAGESKLVKRAREGLTALEEMDAKRLRAFRQWLRTSPAGGGASRWMQLAGADAKLRDRLGPAILSRAQALGISLKGDDEDPEPPPADGGRAGTKKGGNGAHASASGPRDDPHAASPEELKGLVSEARLVDASVTEAYGDEGAAWVTGAETWLSGREREGRPARGDELARFDPGIHRDLVRSIARAREALGMGTRQVEGKLRAAS